MGHLGGSRALSILVCERGGKENEHESRKNGKNAKKMQNHN